MLSFQRGKTLKEIIASNKRVFDFLAINNHVRLLEEFYEEDTLTVCRLVETMARYDCAEALEWLKNKCGDSFYYTDNALFNATYKRDNRNTLKWLFKHRNAKTDKDLRYLLDTKDFEFIKENLDTELIKNCVKDNYIRYTYDYENLDTFKWVLSKNSHITGYIENNELIEMTKYGGYETIVEWVFHHLYDANYSIKVTITPELLLELFVGLVNWNKLKGMKFIAELFEEHFHRPIREEDEKNNNSVVHVIITNKSLDYGILEWLLDQGWSLNDSVMLKSINTCDFKLVKWLYERYPQYVFPSPLTMNCAAAYGDLTVLEWLENDVGCYAGDYAIILAAKHGQLPILDWLQPKMRSFDDFGNFNYMFESIAYSDMIGSNKIDILKWWLQNRTTNNNDAFYQLIIRYAILHNEYDIIKFVYEERPDIYTIETLYLTVHNIDIFQWLYHNIHKGAALSGDDAYLLLVTTAKCKHDMYENMKYLYDLFVAENNEIVHLLHTKNDRYDVYKLLRYSIYYGHFEIELIKWFYEKYKDTLDKKSLYYSKNSKTEFYNSLIWSAAIKGRLDVVKWLYKNTSERHMCTHVMLAHLQNNNYPDVTSWIDKHIVHSDVHVVPGFFDTFKCWGYSLIA